MATALLILPFQLKFHILTSLVTALISWPSGNSYQLVLECAAWETSKSTLGTVALLMLIVEADAVVPAYLNQAYLLFRLTNYWTMIKASLASCSWWLHQFQNLLIFTFVDFPELSCNFILFPSFFLLRCLLRSLFLREQNSEKVTGRAFDEVTKDEVEGTGLLF